VSVYAQLLAAQVVMGLRASVRVHDDGSVYLLDRLNALVARMRGAW
jgi:hypothetical protein